MPRIPGYSSEPSTTWPESFDSLQDLAAYISGPRRSTRFDPAPIPFVERQDSELSASERKLIVCHDYKGGYSEREHERGYTYSWWSSTEIFIYFSHRRVAPPPGSWIRAAHRNGCKILGTLIFEWDAGKLDFDLLLGSGDLRQIVSVETADHLIDLAIERGFEGWLVNVEVPLGLRGGPAPEEHAKALLVWLRYLRDETKRRIPGGETMWYDGANVEGVRWQNRLSDLNADFFEAADSIFLNYFWREDHVKATMEELKKHAGRRMNEVSFGLDVFGRGQFGGGGFSSWRAIDLLEQSSVPTAQLAIESGPSSSSSSTPSPASTFSLALFAPGWTVESEHLGHSLATQETWEQWWEDELYLWTGSAPGPNVEREDRRMEQVRKEERGLHRARELAIALTPGRNNVMAPTPFEYHSPLPPLPGSFRPLTSYFPRPRPPPLSSTFYTNFSIGAGHRFYLEGERVIDSATGWTEVDFAYPFPSLVIPSRRSDVTASLTDEDAWLGGVSLHLQVETGTAAAIVPISPTAVPLHNDEHVTAVVVWKALSPVDSVSLVINGNSSTANRSIDPSRTFEVQDLEAKELVLGWQKASAVITLSNTATEPATISSLGLAISSSSPSCTILVGSLSLSTTTQSLPSLEPVVSDLRWSTDAQSIRWDVGRRVPSIASNSGFPKRDNSRASRGYWPTFAFYILDYQPRDGNSMFLGTTSARAFRLNRHKLERGVVRCRGVREDGAIDSRGETCNV